MQWPFKDMHVGDVVIFAHKSQQYYVNKIPGIEAVKVVYLDRDVPLTRAMTTAHGYANPKGWKFKTKSNALDDGTKIVLVKRVKGDVADPLRPRQRQWVEYGYESLAVGESITFTDPYVISKVLNTFRHRGRMLKRKFTQTTRVNRDSFTYESATIKRVA